MALELEEREPSWFPVQTLKADSSPTDSLGGEK